MHNVTKTGTFILNFYPLELCIQECFQRRTSWTLPYLTYEVGAYSSELTAPSAEAT